MEDVAIKFVFYIDEYTILPVLSKCTLTDVGIKDYEEHFVELNKYDEKFVISVVRNNASAQYWNWNFFLMEKFEQWDS